MVVPGASQSILIAKHDLTKFLWIKVINDTSIDTFEQMSSMGDSSLDLLLYGSSSANPNYPLFFLINKTDGTIDWAFNVSDPSIGDIIPPSASKYRFKTMSARSPTEVYIGATRSDKTYRGLFKFQDL